MKPIFIKHRQAGVGLVEIMIAMVIGLFVVGGLTQIFLSNKQGFRVQEAQSRLQENARLVSVLLSSTIGQAEFQQNAQDDPGVVFPATLPAIAGLDNYSSGVPNNLVAGTNISTLSGTLADTDLITIRFQRDGVVTDCLGSNGTSGGAATAAGTIAVNVYRIDSSNELECNNGVGATPNFQPLLDNVQNMQILYGEDTNQDRSVDRYVNANDIDVNDFDNVLSAHVAMLLASDGDVKLAEERRTYNLLGTEVIMPPAAEDPDRIQRRVIERVIALRNRLL